MNADIYERHRQAVEMWKEACEDMARAKQHRDWARAELDKVSQELLAACADGKPAKPVIKRGRRPKLEKMNGVENVKAVMRHGDASWVQP